MHVCKKNKSLNHSRLYYKLINNVSVTQSSSSESSSNSPISQSEVMHLYKDIFKSILDVENSENKFNGINFKS